MNRKELVVGDEYVLKYPHQGTVAVFKGQHEGRLALSDGSTYFAGVGYLKFEYADDSGVMRTLLLENGAAVEEGVKTAQARERKELADRQAREAAFAAAKALLAELGFELRIGYSHEAKDNPTLVLARAAAGDVDEILLEGITVGKLRRMLEAARLSAIMSVRS